MAKTLETSGAYKKQPKTALTLGQKPKSTIPSGKNQKKHYTLGKTLFFVVFQPPVGLELCWAVTLLSWDAAGLNLNFFFFFESPDSQGLAPGSFFNLPQASLFYPHLQITFTPPPKPPLPHHRPPNFLGFGLFF